MCRTADFELKRSNLRPSQRYIEGTRQVLHRAEWPYIKTTGVVAMRRGGGGWGRGADRGVQPALRRAGAAAPPDCTLHWHSGRRAVRCTTSFAVRPPPAPLLARNNINYAITTSLQFLQQTRS